jgi:hypothetical protein
MKRKNDQYFYLRFFYLLLKQNVVVYLPKYSIDTSKNLLDSSIVLITEDDKLVDNAIPMPIHAEHLISTSSFTLLIIFNKTFIIRSCNGGGSSS